MIESPYLEQLAAHHQYQGKTNDCGPYCAATVINVLRDSQINGAMFGTLMEKVQWKHALPVVRRVKNWATFPWGICGILKEKGIHCQWLIFQKATKMIQLLGTNAILLVIVGGFFPTWSHYKILAAFDPNLGFGFVDPAFRTGEIQWEKMEYFEKHWKCFGNQLICIFPDKPASEPDNIMD